VFTSGKREPEFAAQSFTDTSPRTATADTPGSAGWRSRSGKFGTAFKPLADRKSARSTQARFLLRDPFVDDWNLKRSMISERDVRNR